MRRKKKHHGNKPKIIAAVIITVILVFGVSGAAFAMSAMEAKDDAQALVSQGKQLKDQIVGGDMASAKTTSQQMQARLKTSRHHVGTIVGRCNTHSVVGGDIQNRSYSF